MTDNANWRDYVKYVTPTTDEEVNATIDCIYEHFLEHEPICGNIKLAPPGYRYSLPQICHLHIASLYCNAIIL